MVRRSIALLALVCALAGCTRKTRVEIGVEKQILHLGNGAEPKDLDPASCTSPTAFPPARSRPTDSAAIRSSASRRSESARRKAFDRMERVLHDDAAYVPLAFLNQPHLVSPSVKGWRDNALYAIDWRELWLAP